MGVKSYFVTYATLGELYAQLNMIVKVGAKPLEFSITKS